MYVFLIFTCYLFVCVCMDVCVMHVCATAHMCKSEDIFQEFVLFFHHMAVKIGGRRLYH